MPYEYCLLGILYRIATWVFRADTRRSGSDSPTMTNDTSYTPPPLWRDFIDLTPHSLLAHIAIHGAFTFAGGSSRSQWAGTTQWVRPSEGAPSGW